MQNCFAPCFMYTCIPSWYTAPVVDALALCSGPVNVLAARTGVSGALAARGPPGPGPFQPHPRAPLHWCTPPRSVPKTPSLFKYMRAMVQREPEAEQRLLDVRRGAATTQPGAVPYLPARCARVPTWGASTSTRPLHRSWPCSLAGTVACLCTAPSSSCRPRPCRLCPAGLLLHLLRPRQVRARVTRACRPATLDHGPPAEVPAAAHVRRPAAWHG